MSAPEGRTGSAVRDRDARPTEADGHAGPDPRGAGVAVGLLVAPGGPAARASELARAVREHLLALRQDAAVRVDVREEPALARPAPTVELVEVVRERLLAEGWELAVGVTDVPLRLGRRAIAGHASPTHGVALLSLPALGASRAGERARVALGRLIDETLGEEHDAGAGDRHRAHRLRGRLARLRAIGDQRGGVAAVVTGGYLRLLAGLVWANEPWRFAARLSRALVGALAAAAFALVTTDLWRISDQLGVARLVALTVLSILASTAGLVLAHGLWERSPRPETRAQVALFNLATTSTIVLGVATLYFVLFLATATTALLLLPTSLLAGALGHPADLGDRLTLAWLISSLATIGGGLASGLETDAAVREAAYAAEGDDDTEE